MINIDKIISIQRDLTCFDSSYHLKKLFINVSKPFILFYRQCFDCAATVQPIRSIDTALANRTNYLPTAPTNLLLGISKRGSNVTNNNILRATSNPPSRFHSLHARQTDTGEFLFSFIITFHKRFAQINIPTFSPSFLNERTFFYRSINTHVHFCINFWKISFCDFEKLFFFLFFFFLFVWQTHAIIFC